MVYNTKTSTYASMKASKTEIQHPDKKDFVKSSQLLNLHSALHTAACISLAMTCSKVMPHVPRVSRTHQYGPQVSMANSAKFHVPRAFFSKSATSSQFPASSKLTVNSSTALLDKLTKIPRQPKSPQLGSQ